MQETAEQFEFKLPNPPKQTGKIKPIQFIKDSNGCFICISHRLTPNGYPQKKIRGRDISLSRLIYEQCIGPVPTGLEMRHTCDNPSCINPAHLLVGTHKDNVLDMLKRDRGGKKLREKQVRKIRRSNQANKVLAKKYGVHPTTIKDVKLRRTWKHI